MPLLLAIAVRHRHGGFMLIGILAVAAIGFVIYRVSVRRRGQPHEADVGVTPAPAAPTVLMDGTATPAPAPPLPATRPGGMAETTATTRTAPSPEALSRAAPPTPAWRVDGVPAVETHGLVKRFGTNAAVDGVDLLVPRGCAFGYLGPNGAGKTTLIRTLLGLTRADAGTMSILGVDVPRHRRTALARVGAIVDEPRFHHHLTGRENLLMLAAARGGGADARINASLSRVGLSGRANDAVASYSMGMRQRLGVAACLLGDPELLILDEPMNGLDPAGMLEMRTMLRELVAEGRTVMLSSHLLDEVERTCDAVAIVDHGRVIRQGPIRTLLNDAGATIRVGCTSPDRAASLLVGARGVASATVADGELVVALVDAPTHEAAAALNRTLVEGGVDVYRIEEATTSLEEWFLSVTSRFGADGG